MDAVRASHPDYRLEIVPIVTTGDVNTLTFTRLDTSDAEE